MSYASNALDLSNVDSWLRKPAQPASTAAPDPYVRERGASNLAMTARGQAEVHRAAGGIAKGLQDRMAARPLRHAPDVNIYTSPWDRTAQTAKILAQHVPGADVHSIAELAPQSLGAYEGKPTFDIKDVLDRLKIKDPQNAAPGISTYTKAAAETYHSYKSRILPTIREIMRSSEHDPAAVNIIAAHSGDMKAIRAWMAAGGNSDWSQDHSDDSDIQPGQTDRMTIGNDNKWRYESNVHPGTQHSLTPGIYLQHHGSTEFNTPRPELLSHEERETGERNRSMTASPGQNSSGFPATVTPPTPNSY